MHGNGKWIKEKAPVHLCRDLILLGIYQLKLHSSAGNRRFLIDDSCLIDPIVIFDADRLTPGLIGQEEVHPALAAAIIQKYVVLADLSTVSQAFQNGIGCRLIWILILIRIAVIPAGGLDLQQFIPL